METRHEERRMSGRANPFEWSGGHPALDLVNTLDERPSPSPIENLATYRDLTRFAALAGLVDRRTAARLQQLDSPASHGVKHARKLREHLHEVLATANSGRPARQCDLDALSAAIQAAHAARTLVAPPSPGLANHRWSPRWRVKFHCTPVRSLSSVCSLTSSAKEFANVELQTATSITSTPARASAGNGAA